MRLFGLSWRGWMRVRAFERAFPGKQYALPDNETPPLFDGLIINGSDAAVSPIATDIIITREVASYLHHCLSAIAALSGDMAPYFHSAARAQLPASSWPDMMVLLHAITEFFYFCGFEIPILSNNLIIDLDDPAKLWIYNGDRQQWQAAEVESLSNRIKRDSAMAAHLIGANPHFLSWRAIEDVSVRPMPGLPQASSQPGLQPYRSTGLSRMEINAVTRAHKFHNANKLIGVVIERLTQADQNLNAVFHSPLGGALETIIGMAMLDARAFNLIKDAEPLPDSERFHWLSHFWKTMGKRRPLALLGDGYAKEVAAKLNALGEPSPERSSLLSIQLSTLLSRTAIGESEKPAFQDLLTVLVLADQIRLVELINATCDFVNQATTHILENQHQDLTTLIRSLAALALRQEEEIARRFNAKWLTAPQPIWKLFCACVPANWEYWVKVAKKEGWSASLNQLAPEEALALLLQLCADVIRLIVLLEAASPIVAERLAFDAENTGRAVLNAFHRYQRNISIIELIRFYYDQDVPHDAWIAFTSSFKGYLQQLHNDLQQFDSGAQTAMLANVIKQLELHYPSLTPAKRSAPKATFTRVADSLPIKPALVDDADARAIEMIGGELLAQDGFDRLTFLKLVALLQYPEMRGKLHFFANARNQLRAAFPDAKHRRLFFSAPSVLADSAQFLANNSNAGDSMTISNEVSAQLQEYFTRLEPFQRYVEASLGSSNIFPPECRAELSGSLSGSLSGDLSAAGPTQLILFAVLNRIFCVPARGRAAQSLEQFEEFLHQQAV
jgi:hypothetical protein